MDKYFIYYYYNGTGRALAFTTTVNEEFLLCHYKRHEEKWKQGHFVAMRVTETEVKLTTKLVIEEK